MKKKQIVSFAVIAVILVILVYLQFRSWRTFDWAKFRQYTGGVSLGHIALGIGFIYLGYVMRAIRWSIFLRPTAPTSFRKLLAPQVIGFSALGLFGRAGEFARPYLIARKRGLTFTSQLAVWTVERFFDLGSVFVLIFTFLFFFGGEKVRLLKLDMGHGLASVAANSTHKLPLLLAALAVLAVLYFMLRKAGGKVAGAVRTKLVAFKDGFNTIHDFKSLVQIIVVSVVMWLMIAGAYISVLHAYGSVPVTGADGASHVAQMRSLGLEDVLIIMACSMAGSVIQLPGGVGGSQLAVISILQSHFFNGAPTYVSPELAVSCGIMLWLVTFMSVIPAGILLARYEKISFLRLGEDSAQEEEKMEARDAK
ncbi:MAG: lysylphosphatidylglycerol synthase transmembrane domain-containing protein [Acidobacteriota bacterium]|nr:lysylphosphatidylglycerol synthase transmembrane domain-containing protein [Acidobacteriota bacterium]